MIWQNVLGYLTWDPAREMFPFDLPLLGRPILWYGFFFAFGFFIGYWILRYILMRVLADHPKFQKNDILNWPGFLSLLQKKKKEEVGELFFHALPAKTKKECIEWDKKSPISEETKKDVVRSLNDLLNTPLSHSLPSALKGVITYIHEKKLQLKAINRLVIEQRFSPLISTLKSRATYVAERMTFYVIIGSVVGARLGDLIFYQNFPLILQDPLSIIKVWEGGLASHGGAVGILIALWFLKRKFKKDYPVLTWLFLLDLTVIPTAFVASFIRIGNFFNQEILGKPTDVPWAIIFVHPADGSPAVPRHPVQLYEALFYFSVFIALFCLWRFQDYFKKPGRLSGLFILTVFGFRFGIEYFKVEQSVLIGPHSLFTMGQYLSLPFIFLGGWFLFRK